jgi:hypothetical protein
MCWPQPVLSDPASPSTSPTELPEVDEVLELPGKDEAVVAATGTPLPPCLWEHSGSIARLCLGWLDTKRAVSIVSVVRRAGPRPTFSNHFKQPLPLPPPSPLQQTVVKPMALRPSGVSLS